MYGNKRREKNAAFVQHDHFSPVIESWDWMILVINDGGAHSRHNNVCMVAIVDDFVRGNG